MELSVRESAFQKPAETDIEILGLIRNRWSPRAFADRPVSQADMTILFEAARWAPSSSNQQPWRFIVARRDDPSSFEKLLGVLNPANQVWAKNASILLLAVTKTAGPDGSPNGWAVHDIGLSLAFLALQATALGLQAHFMAGFNPDRAVEAFGIPEGYRPVTAGAIGYVGDPNSLPEALRAKELSPRTRKPLTEILYGTTWGEPISKSD